MSVHIVVLRRCARDERKKGEERGGEGTGFTTTCEYCDSFETRPCANMVLLAMLDRSYIRLLVHCVMLGGGGGEREGSRILQQRCMSCVAATITAKRQ